MKVVQNKNEAKKRKRDDSQTGIVESPKKAKVHAQRKFAQGAAYNSPSITVIKDKVRPPANVSNPGLVLSAKRPNTEDFLTFLCFRRTSILPPKLYFFNDTYKAQPGPTNCVQKTPNSTAAVKNHAPESAAKANSRKSDKSELHKKAQTPVQALRRKYQEQRLAKQNPTNVTKLAQKVKGKNMIRTRSSTLQEETPKPSKELMLLNEGKEPLSGLRSGLQRSPPTTSKYLKKSKNIAEMKNLRSRMKGKVVNKKANVKQLPERKAAKNTSREVPPKRNEVGKNVKSPETSSGKVKDMRVNVKKVEGLSDFSSDDNEPLLAVRKGKPAVKGKKLANGIKEVVRTNCVKTRSQISEILTHTASNTSVRPTRKTKEAAAIYMEMITKKLVSPEKSGDDDRSSVDSFPELPNARRNEQRESEIKAKAMASKRGGVKENSTNSISQVKEKVVRSSSNSNSKKRDLGRRNDSIPPKVEAGKRLIKENASKKVIKEEAPKRVVREAAKNAAKGAVSKKLVKEDTSKKELKEEPPKKIFKAESRLRSAREDLFRKPVRDERKPLREDSTKKEDSLKRAVNESLSKRSAKEEVLRKAGSVKEETTKKSASENVSKKIEKEDPGKKNVNDETMKKNLHEDVSKRVQRDEFARKVAQEDGLKKTSKEEPPKKPVREEVAKKLPQETSLENLTKKTVKEDVQRRSVKEEAAARKQQEEDQKKLAKEELQKKNVRDEPAKKGSNEDLSKKVLRDEVSKKMPNLETSKKSGKAEPGKDEAVKNVVKEEGTKELPQEENATKINMREEISKKTVKEDAAKKESQEDVSSKVTRDEVPEKQGKEETAQMESNENEIATIAKDEPKVAKEETHKRGSQEEFPKKPDKEDFLKKAIKDDSGKKAPHEDVTSKTQKEEIASKDVKEEPLKKSLQEEPPKKNLKDEGQNKIVQESLPKKSETTKDNEPQKEVQKEEPKKIAEDQLKRATEEEIAKKQPEREEPTLKVVKEEITKKVEEEEPKNKAVNAEVPKEAITSKGSVKDGGATRKAGKEETAKDEPLRREMKEEAPKKVGDELRKATGEVGKGGSRAVSEKLEEQTGEKKEGERGDALRRATRNPSKEEVAKSEDAGDRKAPEENEFRPSTRGRKQEAESEAKAKKLPERTCGVKKPNSVPKKGCGSAAFVPSSSWLPPPGSGSNLVEAPTFYPTEKEFQDPLEFFERIRPAAESFGLCRIVPPSTFKPDCKVSDDMRFTAYNQYVHRMFHRWGPNIKEMMAIKKYLATQSISLKQPPWIGGIEVDLPRLYQSVQNCGGLMKVMEKKKWNQVADMMRIPKAAQDRVTKLDDIYCKYLLPYDTLSHDERQKLFEEVESDWLKRQESTNDSADEESEEEFYIDECEECIVKGRNMALNQFYRIARNTMSMWFKTPEPSPSEVENEFWRHVSERTNHVCVHSGSIDSSGWGYGFPVAKNNSFSRHPWNLKVLTNNSGSVLRSLGPVMGVTVPTLHVGMVFTAFCWYRDPHGLPWVEYLHTGAPKIWYGISDDNSAVFKDALTKLLPRYIKNKKIWLPSDTAMVPPALLVEQGVSLCHTIQKPGQFILVFPRAFTSSICTGYLVSESVYFAQPSWLTTAEQVFKDIQDCCEPTMFSLEKLLFSIATDSRSSVEVLKQVLPMVWHIKQNEIDGRKMLCNLGLKVSERLPIRDQGGSKKRKGRWAQDGEGDYECEVCRTNLNVSLVINSQEEGVLCLPHAIELLTQKRHHLKYCKLMYSYTQEELCELVEKLEQRIESKSLKKVQSKSTAAGK